MLRIILGILQPSLDEVQELVLIEILRAVFLNAVEHEQEVLFDPFLRSMMHDVDADRHFLPVSWSPFLPKLNLMWSLKGSSEKFHPRASSQSRVLQLLCEIKFGLGAPSG